MKSSMINLNRDRLHREIEAAKRDYELALWWNNSKARYYTAVHAMPFFPSDEVIQSVRVNAAFLLNAELITSGEMQDAAKKCIQNKMRQAGYRETYILAELALLDN